MRKSEQTKRSPRPGAVGFVNGGCDGLRDGVEARAPRAKVVTHTREGFSDA